MDAREEQTVICASLLFASVYLETCVNRTRRKRKRKTWVKGWIERRAEKGVYNNILNELRLDDAESYRRYLRMNMENFEVSNYKSFLINTQGFVQYVGSAKVAVSEITRFNRE